MKDSSYYFQHDYNARNDPKIINLMVKYGLEGVGVYWCIVEQLYQAGGTLPLERIESIAYAMHMECKCITSVIKDFDLFKNDGTIFWSDSIIKRLHKRKIVSEVRKKASDTRWEREKAMQMQSKCNANAMQVQCKSFDLSNKDINNNTLIIDKRVENKVSTHVDFEKIIDLYHSICKSYPRIMKLSEDRKRKVEIRFKDEMKCDYSIVETLFRKMEESKFLRGDNQRGWKATFDWLFANEKNWVKVAEGNYDNRTKISDHSDKTKFVNDEWDD